MRTGEFLTWKKNTHSYNSRNRILETLIGASMMCDVNTLIDSKDWDANIAREIIECESQWRPRVVNDNPATGDYSVGLMQINLYGDLAKDRPSEEWLKDPFNNVNYAYRLYKKNGWQPWACFTQDNSYSPH